MRPAVQTMEPVYTDNEFLYKVAPFSFKENQIGRMMACVSYLYYGIAKYEMETGRFLNAEDCYTDRDYVHNKFDVKCMENNWVKIDDPYFLYDLRISNGYLY